MRGMPAIVPDFLAEKIATLKIKKILSLLNGEYVNSYYIEEVLDSYKGIGNNIVFDALADNKEFADAFSYLFRFSFDEYGASIDAQKKIIFHNPEAFTVASDELKNDPSYVAYVYNIAKKASIEFNPYVYLGDKLLQDKDYVKIISELEPIVMLNSIKQYPNLYTEDEIVSFFLSHPDYRSIPKGILTIPGIIKLLKNMTVSKENYYFRFLTLEEVKNEEVKKILIDLIGEEGYKYNYVRLMLDEKEEKNEFNTLTIPELQNLMRLSLDAFLYSFSDYLVDFDKKWFKENFKLNNEQIKFFEQLSKIITLSTSSKKLNSQEIINCLTAYADVIGVTLDKEYLLEQVGKHSSEFSSFICNGSLVGLNTIVHSINCRKVPELLAICNTEELMKSPYLNDLSNVIVSDNNIDFLRLIAGTCLIRSSAEKIEFYQRLFLCFNLDDNPYDDLAIIIHLSYDNNLLNLLLNTDLNTLSSNNIEGIKQYIRSRLNRSVPIKSLEELADYDTFIDNNIDSILLTASSLKEKILFTCFHISYNEAESLLHSYFNLIEDSALYLKREEIVILKELLEKVLNADSLEELTEIEKNYQNIRISYAEIQDIKESIRNDIGNELNNSLVTVPAHQGIYDFSDRDFRFLIHVVGAYGTTPLGDIYESWNTRERSKAVSLSCSYVADDNMGTAKIDDHSVIFAFSDLEEGYLKLMACYDLYSESNGAYIADRESRFMLSDELIDNTRHGHNELVVGRKNGRYGEDKLQPSCIICFDTINDESREASDKFDIPIIFIDREKVAKRWFDRINDMINEYEKSLNPLLIERIIVEQENCRSGLKLGRIDLLEKYFSRDIRQANIERLYKIISNHLDSQKGQEGVAIFIKSIEREKEKVLLANENEMSERRSSFDLDCDDMLSSFKKKNGSIQDDEVAIPESEEERYEKFRRARQRYADQESMFLDEINRRRRKGVISINAGK